MSTQLLPEFALPMSTLFDWRTDDKEYKSRHRLFFKCEYSGIEISPSKLGAYVVSLGGVAVFETQTMSQAQASAQEIGWALRLKLPVTDWIVDEPGPSQFAMSQERWEGLLDSLKANTLSPLDAECLKNAMLERKDDAQMANDNRAIATLEVGITLLERSLHPILNEQT